MRTMSYALTVRTAQPFEATATAVRDALAAQGFGILTEIDMTGTPKAKLDVDVPAQVILGACNPPLAYRALQAEESIGLLLPCNVVVRGAGDGQTIVQAMDPQVMVGVTENDALRTVADAAAARLRSALEALPTA